MTTILKCVAPLFLLFLCTDELYAQKPAVQLPGTESIKFTSAINQQQYELQISLPGSYKDPSKKYPVLYVLDGQWVFPLINGINGGLYYDGFLPELIIVGIGYVDNYEVNRAMDFTPTRVKDDPGTGGAPKFLQVLQKEIIARIDSMYHTDKGNNALCGGSSGGLFALYSLLTEPALFNRFIIGSPSVDIDHGMIFRYEREFRQRHSALKAKVFISAGEYELALYEKDPITAFVHQLTDAKYQGLEIENLVIEKMGHASSGPYTFGRAMQFLYARPDLKLDTVILDRYAGRYKSPVDTVVMTRKGYALSAAGNWNLRLTFSAETPETFYVKGLSGKLHFEKDSSGKVTGYTLMVNNASIPYAKID